jgi:nucleoside-diphosphate-sugar epimerase
MKVLITGATGFLGRWVLDLLCADPRVTSIVATSRSVRSHPSSKVEVVLCDLSTPVAPQLILETKFDVVVHLAAQYNFGTDYQTNFLNNVVATQNLLHWLRARPESKPRIVFTSTYAVGAGVRDALRSETALRELPPRHQPYARTKYVSEQIVLESEFPATALRLGILVGDRTGGTIEKFDGPYTFLRALFRIKHSKILSLAPFVPVIARKDAVLPLVPVDCAARVVCAAAMRSDQMQDKQIFGVYNPVSISCGRFAEATMQFLQIDAPLKFLPEPPQFVLKLQQRFTEMVPEVFDYACNAPSLSNRQFEKSFPDLAIPDFSLYQDAFFSGFIDFMGDENGAT